MRPAPQPGSRLGGMTDCRERRKPHRLSPADVIVVALVGAILFGIGTPRFARFLHQTEAIEPAARMPLIVRGMQAFVDANPQLSPATLNAMLTDGILTVEPACRHGGAGASCLVRVVPAISIPDDSRWRYRIVAQVTGDRTVRACVLARHFPEPAGDGAPDPGGVLYSSETEPGIAGEGWHHGVHVDNYVVGHKTWTGTAYGACAEPSDPPMLRHAG